MISFKNIPAFLQKIFAYRKEYILLFISVFCINGKSYSQLLTIEEITVKYSDTESFSEDELIPELGLKESDVYKPSVLGENIYKLQKFYFDRGFFDAEIDTVVKYDLLNEEVFIEIIVIENLHYRIDS